LISRSLPLRSIRSLRCWIIFAAALGAAPALAQPPVTPTIAIIIDDVGYRRAEALRLIDIPAPLTLSFLPFLPHTRDLALRAHGAGKEIMLHIPMQNGLGTDLGPAGLTLSLNQDVFTDRLRRALRNIPYVRGLNNHTGSVLTQHRRPMEWTMQEVSRYPLYFVDSRTTAQTVAQKVAQEYQIPNLARDVFLDHEISEEAVDREFKRLIRIARKTGTAIAIGHPHEVTVSYLERELPKLGEQGVAIATISALWMIRNNGVRPFDGRLPTAELPEPVQPLPEQLVQATAEPELAPARTIELGYSSQ